MQLLVILQKQSFFGAIRRTSVLPSSSPHYFRWFGSSFCSLTPIPDAHFTAQTSESEKEEEEELEEKDGKSLSWRIERLPREKPVISAFQSWMGDGFPIQRGDIIHTINRLRKVKANKRALQVMEWVIRERPYRLKELDYSYLLEFTTRLHGVSRGETLFSHIPKEFQNDFLYNSFILACLEKGLIRLPLTYMKKMRELGHPISYLVFNRLIILHASPGRRKSIPKILAQMKADKVARHVSTFNILLKMEADDHNIQRLVQVFGDMQRAAVEPNEITYCIMATAHAAARLFTACEAFVESIEKSKAGNNWSTFDILVILYGYLGKRNDLERTWNGIQELPIVRSKSYVLAVEAFGKLGDIIRAEEIWSGMKLKKGMKLTEQLNSLISVYCKHGLITKATGLYKEMEKIGCKPNAITLRHLALGCLKAGLKNEAIKTLELGMGMFASTKVRKSTPWLETTLSIVEIFADHGDVDNVEKLFEELKKANYTRYTFVYNTLIKAYVKAKLHDPNLLKRMILGGSRPDSETYSLLKLMEQFPTK
ncbi:OLC1v1007623C1 [Oldenlandia corymbosa var. corymbosa]|uniref:OLC1v1007623C1 n=1 Tax=Oldenlandia corymbosa var. corymbosa TaxID=529605 RepID=A0AAV1DJQ3_OLDCO|nr:OLC1v1007623C1 [Oldenlandia corymbosa var. corymbosa]